MSSALALASFQTLEKCNRKRGQDLGGAQGRPSRELSGGHDLVGEQVPVAGARLRIGHRKRGILPDIADRRYRGLTSHRYYQPGNDREKAGPAIRSFDGYQMIPVGTSRVQAAVLAVEEDIRIPPTDCQSSPHQEELDPPITPMSEKLGRQVSERLLLPGCTLARARTVGTRIDRCSVHTSQLCIQRRQERMAPREIDRPPVIRIHQAKVPELIPLID